MSGNDKTSRSNGTPELVPPGTPGSGENVCRRCEGKGKLPRRRRMSGLQGYR